METRQQTPERRLDVADETDFRRIAQAKPIGFQVDRSGISEVGRIAHDPIDVSSPQIDRSLVIGQQLFTLSGEGVMASSLATLAREAFVTFPAPAPAASGTSSSPLGRPAR